jgi:hypothetical protein
MSEKAAFYAAIKKRCEEKRKSEPEPKRVSGGGALTPLAIAGKPNLAESPQLGRSWSRAKMLSEAVKIWHRFAWADVIRIAEEMGGYEQLVLGLKKNHRQGVIDAARQSEKKLALPLMICMNGGSYE